MMHSADIHRSRRCLARPGLRSSDLMLANVALKPQNPLGRQTAYRSDIYGLILHAT